jgi:hypothetical protein
MPVSADGKFTSVKLDMSTSVINTPITNTVVNVPGPQTTAYRVTVENLPESFVVKSILYGTTDLLTNTLRLTPSNFTGTAARTLQVVNVLTAAAAPPQPNAVTSLQQLPQNEQDLLSYLMGLAAGRGVALPPGTTQAPNPPASLPAYQVGLTAAVNSAAVLATPQPQTPLSVLYVTLAPASPKAQTGARVSGRMSVAGRRTVYLSGIPGNVYSDGTFEVYGVPPGRHSIVTRENPGGLKPLAASVVVENGNLDGIVLAETAMLPIRAWEPSPPKPAGGHPVGNVPLARLTGSLIEEASKQPIAEGTVLIKSNGYFNASFPVDADGRFELPPLLPGTYDLEVQIFGHSNIKQSFEIDDKDMKLELISRKLY